jgi:SAM-dependent methyltransferase
VRDAPARRCGYARAAPAGRGCVNGCNARVIVANDSRVSIYEPFAAVYDRWFPVTEDIPFYVGLAREAAGPLVELAVGTGRVAIPVARETGRRVLGIDLEPAMLAQAEERAQEAGVDVELRVGDMRELELDEPAGLIYVPARSLLHLPTWADRRSLFERVHAALLPGGRFAWNAFVFDPHIAAGNDGVWGDQNGIRHRVDHFPHDNRLEITLESGAAIPLWWLTRSEWEGLIDVAGFEVEALYGGFEGQPFDETAREFVWVVRKPV